MSRNLLWFSITLTAAAVLVAPVSAQSTIDGAAVDAAVSAPRPDARAVVGHALSAEAAVNMAGHLGLSQQDVADRVASLDDDSAQMLADRILAGGDTIVISATALIIILLLLILITK